MRAMVFACAALLLVASSAAVAKKPVDPVSLPKDAVGAPAESVGTVIGTLGYRDDQKPIVATAALFFRRVGSEETGVIHIDHSKAKLRGDATALNAKGGDFRYAAFKMALPEGQYELIGVMGSYGIMPGSNTNDGSLTIPRQFTARGIVGVSAGSAIGNAICAAGSSGDVSTSDVFSVPFEVKRGGVLYLGSFAAHGTTSKGRGCFIPMPVPSTIYLSWADKWQRDQVALSTGDTAVDASVVEHPALAVNAPTGYFIIAEDHVPEERTTMKDYKSGRSSHAGKIAEYTAAHPEENAYHDGQGSQTAQ